jgi:hypothetical protein
VSGMENIERIIFDLETLGPMRNFNFYYYFFHLFCLLGLSQLSSTWPGSDLWMWCFDSILRWGLTCGALHKRETTR